LFKWVIAVGAYFLFGRSFFAAIIGFVVGSFVDNYQTTMAKLRQNAEKDGRSF